MTVASVLNRHGGLSTIMATPRPSNASPIVTLASVSAGEGAGNV